MKNTIRNFGGLTVFGAMLFTANLTLAQPSAETITTTTTTSAGTITQFGEDTFVVRTATSTAPLRYSYTKTTTYVDESGNPVSIETVKSGVPVTVYYDKDADKMVATKIVVRRAAVVDPTPRIIEEKKTTTTTTRPTP